MASRGLGCVPGICRHTHSRAAAPSPHHLIVGTAKGSSKRRASAVEALAATFYNDSGSNFNASPESFASKRLVVLVTIEVTDSALSCSRLAFVQAIEEDPTSVKDEINEKLKSRDSVESIELGKIELSSSDGNSPDCPSAYTGSSAEAKHIIYLVTFGTIAAGALIFLYILVTESFKLYCRSKAHQDRDALVTYDSSLASSMYKRDSRSAIPGQIFVIM